MDSKIRYFKIIKKYLSSQTFNEDGFIYTFEQIFEKKGAVYAVVDVKLPNPKQSWVATKFSHDIQNILYNLNRFIGESFSFSIKTTINGVDVENYKYCYVSPERQNEILESLNSNLSKITINNRNGYYNNLKTEFKIQWSKPDKNFYVLEDTDFSFLFNLWLYDFNFLEKDVKPKEEMVDDMAGLLGSELMDSDDFRQRAEDIIYYILEPELKIQKIDDIYISISTNINRIDTYDANQNWNSGVKISSEMFTEI